MIGGFVDGLLDALGDLGPGFLHLAIAGLAFAETALLLDLLVPGEVGMVLAGAAAHRAEVQLPGLVLAGAVGAALGDSCSYGLGRLVAAGRLPGTARALQRVQPSLRRAESFFARRGGAAVFLARWVGALRAVVPFVAGAARMPYGTFLAWNVAASVGWVATVVTSGWVLGSAVAVTVDRVGAVVSVLAVGGLVVWFPAMRRRRARPTVNA